MLDYLDFWYVHVPPIHNQSIQKTNLQYLKNGMLEDINWLWSCMFRFAQHNYSTELY